MIALADCPCWSGPLFTLAGVLIGGSITFITQRSIYKATRIKERYAQLRGAYARFVAAGVRYTSAQANFWVRNELVMALAKQLQEVMSMNLAPQEVEVHKSRLEAEQGIQRQENEVLEQMWAELQSATLLLIGVESNSTRRKQIREQELALHAGGKPGDGENSNPHRTAHLATEAARNWVDSLWVELETEEAAALSECWFDS